MALIKIIDSFSHYFKIESLYGFVLKILSFNCFQNYFIQVLSPSVVTRRSLATSPSAVRRLRRSSRRASRSRSTSSCTRISPTPVASDSVSRSISILVSSTIPPPVSTVWISSSTSPVEEKFGEQNVRVYSEMR